MKLPFSNSLAQLLGTLTSTLGELGDSVQEREFTISVMSHPSDASLVYRETTVLLRSFNHPIGQYMQQYAVRFKQQYADQVNTKPKDDPEIPSLVQNMTSETHAFNSEIFQSLSSVSLLLIFFFFFCSVASLYEKMLERYTFLEPMSSVVRQAIEDELFSATSRILMTGYEKKLHTVDDSLFLKLCLLQEVSPSDLGVKEKFCLDDVLEGQDCRPVPYIPTIITFKKIALAHSPSEKAAILSQVTREISMCVKNYWEGRGVELVGDKYAM